MVEAVSRWFNGSAQKLHGEWSSDMDGRKPKTTGVNGNYKNCTEMDRASKKGKNYRRGWRGHGMDQAKA